MDVFSPEHCLAQGFAKPVSRARAVARRGICDGAIARCSRYRDRGTPAEDRAGLRLTIQHGWFVLHKNGSLVK